MRGKLTDQYCDFRIAIFELKPSMRPALYARETDSPDAL